ncbi:MAG: hypothetical protein JXR70_19415 [Spirochaetales bacterium]|nr:hypothetical protein [Spirochaetales bacterium]
MKTIKTILILMTLLLSATALFSQNRSTIQLAILLDTSNSMDGLINQAKSNLWKIINKFAAAKREGQAARLEVALYEYGNDWLSAKSGYIRKVLTFTEDLDGLSEELFRLETNGGEEYCGMVIQQAMAELPWSNHQRDMKVIYIAGNEGFNQGPMNFRDVCQWADKKSIKINTIYCGDYNGGISGLWKEGALIGGGKYMNINQDMEIRHYDTPYDDRILELNLKLNNTYIPYGHEGKKFKERQEAQDANAMSIDKSVLSERAAAKSTGKYSNSQWDILDGITTGAIDLENLDKEALPAEMAEMTTSEQKAYIQEMSAQRKKIQEEIADLSSKRDQYIAKLEKENSNESSLDKAIIDSVVDLGTKMGFDF